MNNPKSRILIVDDHPAVREALALRIGRQEDLEVCGEAADAIEAMRVAEATHPDVAVVDITLKDSSGIELLKRIRAHLPSVRVLIWSMHNQWLYAERALRAGAYGYVNKDQATDTIVDAIRSVLAGKVYLTDSVAQRILHRAIGANAGPSQHARIATLTNRELEVLRLVGQGIKTAEIAARMRLSVKTIETYRDRIRRKLELDNGTELTHYATLWVLENG
jgi:DNA-binding NarL/FixJ family response regulator